MAEFEFTIRLKDRIKVPLILLLIDWLDNVDDYDTMDQMIYFDREFVYLLDIMADHLFGHGLCYDPYWFIAFRMNYFDVNDLGIIAKRFEVWAETLKKVETIPRDNWPGIRKTLRNQPGLAGSKEGLEILRKVGEGDDA